MNMRRPLMAVLAGLLLSTGGILRCPIQAQDKPDVNRWEKAITAFEKQDQDKAPPKNAVLFVGSSSIRMWDLAKSFPDVETINRGFGGSQLADSVHFAPRIVVKHQPRLVVLYAGDNDVAAGKTPERVFADFKAFVQVVHKDLPKTRIAYLSIKASVKRWNLADKIRQVNSLIEGFCKQDERLICIDTFKPMLGDNGQPRPDLFLKDGLHLNDKGYEIWAGLVKPHLASKEMCLAGDGKARMPIVIAAKASDATKKVARELAECLTKITGAKFDVQSGDGSKGIVLGTLDEFPNPTLAKDLEIRNTCDGKEAFAIRTEAERLLLIGATELATSHAAFRFLEELGCRWFFPAPEWTVLPTRPTLNVRVNLTDRPVLLSRRIWYGYGFFDRNRCLDDYQAWCRHNRMAASLRPNCGHAWQNIILTNKKTFDAHPEYLALVKGLREGPQLCVSNPEVRAIALQYVREQLKRRPDLDMVSLETSDGMKQCECAECRKLGNVSDRAFGLANDAARMLSKESPGKMIGMLAYSDHCEPPSFALEPNVYVQSTAGFIRGRYTFEELMELWPKRCKNLGFYEYLSVWPWDHDLPAGGRAANLKYLRERFPRYAQLGATSIDCESGDNWGPHGLGYYVANRLMWGPKADVDALLADFFDKAFGPAASAMRRYYERLDPGSEPLVSEHLLALALRDLDEASNLAKDRPDVQARLDHLKQYQHYVRLRWEIDRARDKQRKMDLTAAALRHVYRTRYNHMNHWQAMLQSWTPAAAKEFNRPSWSVRDKSPGKPWKVDEQPCTHEETERLFREDLDYFKPQTFAEKTFSAELVPAGITSEKPAELTQRFQRGARYALYSAKGEPLQFSITTGVIAWYRDRPDVVYVVSDAAGKEIVKARLAQDGEEHAVTVKLPSPGLYWLDVNDQGAGWGIKIAAGQPAALTLRRGNSRPTPLGQMKQVFFLVPKGTKQIEYYWDGPAHDVRAPTGKVAAEVTSRGKIVTVPVPEGADGQAWSFTRLGSGRLWFFNVPNYLSASPDGLLTPREVAKR